jgi:hypothetical protein
MLMLGQEEHREAHAAMLSVVAGDQFLLHFGKSNGARFVSAMPAVMKIKKPSGCGTGTSAGMKPSHTPTGR